jgi:hypothetical protein
MVGGVGLDVDAAAGMLAGRAVCRAMGVTDAGFRLGRELDCTTGARFGTNTTGAATARQAGVASTRFALGAATVAASQTTSAAAASHGAVPPSTVFPHSTREARLNGSAKNWWSSALRARTGGIAGFPSVGSSSIERPRPGQTCALFAKIPLSG